MCDLEKALSMQPTRVYYNGVLIKKDGKDASSK